jgi:TPR repeat/Tetratricopeptide repeat
MSILSSHAASWHSDKWYRLAWYIWPQTISLLFIGWLFVGVLPKPPEPPWAVPQPPSRPQPPSKPQPPDQQSRPQDDEIVCWVQSNLNACNRLIDAGKMGFYFHRAQIHFRNGDYDRAIADLSAFIQRNPNSVRALNDRGLSYEKKGEYDKAIADYSEVIRLVKDSALSYSYRGSAYEKKGEYDKAIADYSEVIRLDKDSALPYYNRGSAYEKKGELDKALSDFREALNHGSTTASEDINRVERAIESLRPKYGFTGLGFSGLSLSARISFQSPDYQEYQCTPSGQFEAVTWCNKQRFEKEARGLYRSSYTIAHSRDGTIYYLNRSQEPAFFNAGEVDSDIEYFSRKFGEQARRVRPHVRPGPNTDRSSPFGAKLHWNHLMQLEQANWQLGEVLVGESWSTFLEICQSQLGEAWTFIASLVALVSFGQVAVIPVVREPCVSSRLTHPLCCRS